MTAKLETRAFLPDDYVRLSAHAPTIRGLNVRKVANAAAEAGPGFTMLADGQVVACAGVILCAYPGVGKAWSLIGREARHYGVYLTRRVMRGLAGIVRDHHLWRVDAECVADDERAAEWLEYMGFKQECRARMAGPHGIDMLRYAVFPKVTQGAPTNLLDGWNLERGVWTGPRGEQVGAIAGGYGTETILIIAAVAAIAAAGVGAYASYEQGQAQGKAARYNARVQENQALAAKQQAEFAANQQREQTRRLLARERALYGSSGVDVGVGSPLLVVADTAMQGELEAQAILKGGADRQSSFRAQAGLDRFMGRQAEMAGNIGAGATLLSGLGSAAGGYARYSGTTPTAGSNTLRVPSAGYGSVYDAP